MVPLLVLVTVSPGARPLSDKPIMPPVRNMELAQVWLVPTGVHCCANAGAPGHSTAAVSADEFISAAMRRPALRFIGTAPIQLPFFVAHAMTARLVVLSQSLPDPLRPWPRKVICNAILMASFV